MKTHSWGGVRGSRGFAQYFSSLMKSELLKLGSAKVNYWIKGQFVYISQR
jgi:hypothetical protein